MGLEEVCKELKFTKSLHNAMSGSKYFKINNVKFRISDHEQPSNFQIKEYFDVSCENDIIKIIQNKLFSYYSNPIVKGDDFFDAKYNEENDTFSMKKITKTEYNNLVLKMKKRNQFWIKSGYLGSTI